jgi:multiple sugar transport system substrate-binding protein
VKYDPAAWFTGSGSRFHAEFGAAVQNTLLRGDDPAAAVQRFRRRLDAQLRMANPADPEGGAA